MKTLHDLFIHELQDLYSAEQQIIGALPKMAEAATSSELKTGFEEHLEQTKNQIKRLEQVGNHLETDLNGKHCKGMEGLIKEGEELLKEDADPQVMDAGLIAIAQKVEHYEIAGYGTAATFAKEMGHDEALTLLMETLDEEKETDEKLTRLAKKDINKQADTTSSTYINANP